MPSGDRVGRGGGRVSRVRITLPVAVSMRMLALVAGCQIGGGLAAQGRPDAASDASVGRVGLSPVMRVPTGSTWSPSDSALPRLRGPVPERRAPWWAPVASAVLPGAGQFAMGQQRSVGYGVAEAYLLLQALGAQRDGQRQREAYRSLAASVARARFAASPAVGDWDYYESMEKFLESGVFDRVPGGGVDPELDESTFNGARWLLARQIYWRDPGVTPPVTSPEYQRALAFYEARAVRDPYRWSWRDAQLEQDVYRQTITEANRSFQRAVTLTGIVWMNHLASLVDAYVSLRIRRYGGAGVAGVSVEAVSVRMLPPAPVWGAAPRVAWQVRLAPASRRP